MRPTLTRCGIRFWMALSLIGGTLACSTAYRQPPLMPDGHLASRGRLGEPLGIAADADAIYFAEDVPGGADAVIRRVSLEDGRITTLVTGVLGHTNVIGLLNNALVVNEGLSGPVRVDAKTGERYPLIHTPDDGINFRAVATDGASVVLLRRRDTIWLLDRGSETPRHVAGRENSDPYQDDVSGDNGPATQAGLGSIEDAAIDPDGHVYISHSGARADEFRIRRVDAVTGTITTVVGPGTVVRDEDGKSRRVRPEAMTVGRDGSVFFVDHGTRVLRYAPKTAEVTIVAGGARGRGGDGGPARRARFERIWDLAAAADDSLLIFDYGANRIRLVDRDGRIRTIVGNDDRLYGHARWSMKWLTEPPPDNERCSNRLDPPGVTIVARDEGDGAVSGVVVRLYRIADFQAAAPNEPRALATGTIAADGSVTLQAPAGGSYLVIAAFPGFTPTSRTVTLSAGCQGELSLLMRPIGTTSRAQ